MKIDKNTFYIYVFLSFFSLVSCVNIEYYELDDYLPYAEQYRPFPKIKTKGENNSGTLTYPNVNTILQSYVVTANMNDAWNRMMNSCTQNGRREFGFWICYDHENQSFWCCDMDSGPMVSYLDGGYVNLRELKTAKQRTQACAFFHTHTSFHLASTTCSRLTGPSTDDISLANNIFKVPGILYDYPKPNIWGGHPVDKQYITYTFGPNQRAPHSN